MKSNSFNNVNYDADDYEPDDFDCISPLLNKNFYNNFYDELNDPTKQYLSFSPIPHLPLISPRTSNTLQKNKKYEKEKRPILKRSSNNLLNNRNNVEASKNTLSYSSSELFETKFLDDLENKPIKFHGKKDKNGNTNNSKNVLLRHFGPPLSEPIAEDYLPHIQRSVRKETKRYMYNPSHYNQIDNLVRRTPLNILDDDDYYYPLRFKRESTRIKKKDYSSKDKNTTEGLNDVNNTKF